MKKTTSAVSLILGVAACLAAEAPTPAPGISRFKFQAYDGDPKNPEKMEFQINPLDAGTRTQFVKIGEIIEGTKLKVIKFEFKAKNAAGEKEDVSELSVRDTASGKVFILPLNKVVPVSAPAK